MSDCISRQAAIEAIKEDKIDLTNPNVVAVFKATGDFKKVETQVMTCDRHIKILKDLPSAQSYTDEEIQKMQDIEQAQLDKAYEMGKADAMRWIPCGERLPENGYFLWSAKGGEVQKDFYWDGHWEQAEKYGYEVIAWMPLPEPYKRGEEHE